MKRSTRSALLFLALGLGACERAPEVLHPAAAATHSSAHPPEERIGPGVLEAIREGGGAGIMVALDVAEERGLEPLRRNVAAAQEAVMRGHAPRELHVRRRFAAVPALAATARSEAAILRLANHPLVRRIDLDVGGTGELAASVRQVGAGLRHARGNDGKGVVVAILDSGIDTDHPDLADDVVHQACFGNADPYLDGRGFCPNGSDRQTGPGSAEDDAGHGTHVAGIITSRGTVGAPGVAPGAGVVAVKVLNNCSFAGCFQYYSEIVAALDYLIANQGTLGVKVLNMSVGTGARFTGVCDNVTAYNMAGSAAINTLRGLGVIAFASAGNNGSGTGMTSPACLANVVSVGASDPADQAAFFTNSNATTDLFAPGVFITSLARGGGTIAASGTSMASPHAAGCAALLFQARPSHTPATVEARLKASAVRVTNPRNGLAYPRIDCSPDPNLAPVVSAGGPFAAVEGASVVLAGAAATDPEGTPLALRWSVDSPLCRISDPAALAPSLWCEDDGSFVLTLAATDGEATTTAAAVLTVANASPVIGAFALSPDTVVVGRPVTASGSFRDVPADAPRGTLAWGDGTLADAPAAFEHTHRYLRSGVYAVELQVVDDDGGSARATRPVAVLSPAEATAVLARRVAALELERNGEHPLVMLLRNAAHSMERGEPDAAAQQLGAFLHYLAAQRGAAIPAAEADALAAAARDIADALQQGLS